MQRSEMALIANESEDVVFEERECSLDLLHTFRSSEKYEKKPFKLLYLHFGQDVTLSDRLKGGCISLHRRMAGKSEIEIFQTQSSILLPYGQKLRLTYSFDILLTLSFYVHVSIAPKHVLTFCTRSKR